MAKQEGKQTRKQKIAEGQKPEAKQPRVVKVEEKGPVPASYAPNNARKLEAERQVFAKKIADSKHENQYLVSGKTGTYLTGYTEGNHTEGHYFNVVTKDVPANAGKEGYALTLINGDVSAHEGGEPVSIPHSWLFKNISNVKFAGGRIGEIQYAMLQFLQHTLNSEIAEEKFHRNEDAEAAKKAAQVAIALDHPGRGALFSLATNEGKTVKSDLRLCSLSGFGPQQFGRYDFVDGKSHCVVEYIAERGKEFVRIHSMQPDHQLAKAGVQVGLSMYAKNLMKECTIPTPDKSGLAVDVYAHLCLFRSFLIQSLDQLEAKKQRKAA